MKQKKLSKKLSINKLTVSTLTEIQGGAEKQTYPNDCRPTLLTCYEYTCPGWTVCPNMAC